MKRTKFACKYSTFKTEISSTVLYLKSLFRMWPKLKQNTNKNAPFLLAVPDLPAMSWFRDVLYREERTLFNVHTVQRV